MKAYKLCRLMADGTITSLFINNTKAIEFNAWLPARRYPTAGFKTRAGWHCTAKPIAPHLSKVGRVWAEVEIEDYKTLIRLESQGGIWYLAKKIKFVRILQNKKKNDRITHKTTKYSIARKRK